MEILHGLGLSAGGILSVLLHGLALASLLSAFGSLLFLSVLVPPALRRLAPQDQAVARNPAHSVARSSLLLAVLFELLWLGGESSVMAGAASSAEAAGAVIVVVRATDFGHLVIAQILTLLAAFLFSTWHARPALATVLAGLAVVFEAWHLHGAAMRGGLSPLLASELLHLLSAGAWLGGLLPLALFIRSVSPAAGALAARRFSALASFVVLVLVITAFWQGRTLVGSLSALVRTAYGWVALVKLALFVILTGFAVRHRFRLTPALGGPGSIAARDALARSILWEAGFGIAIVLVAAFISALAPPAEMTMHMSCMHGGSVHVMTS